MDGEKGGRDGQGRIRETADERKLHQQTGVDRIVDFGHNVMGFAITLLVTGITVQPGIHDLKAHLFSLWPQFIAYFLSFYVIGDNWIVYSRIFSHIIRYDEKLYWLNLLFLFFIAFLPFPTSLVSDYPGYKIPVLLYSTVIICVIFARTLLWWYASKDHRLVHETLDPAFIRKTLLNAIFLLCGFFVVALIAFFSVSDAISLWVVLGVFSLLSRFRLYKAVH
ncbi:MAG: TMEM175 family protein [Deltaproteobacteria bacterium]